MKYQFRKSKYDLSRIVSPKAKRVDSKFMFELCSNSYDIDAFAKFLRKDLGFKRYKDYNIDREYRVVFLMGTSQHENMNLLNLIGGEITDNCYLDEIVFYYELA